MKLIEGLKSQKTIVKKIEDLQSKISKHSAYSSLERPVYRDDKDPDNPKTQTEQIKSWKQAILDLTKLLANTRLCIQYTNMITLVTIDAEGVNITKPIAEWIHWRRDLSEIMYRTVSVMTDKNLKEGFVTNSQGEKSEVKIVRCYNPAERDSEMDSYRNLKFIIDSTLEVVNATTDMVELSEINKEIASRSQEKKEGN